MSVSGDSFCKSAWHGFLLDTKYLLEFEFAMTLARLFVFMGKIMIAAINGLTFYILTKYILKE